MFSVFLVAGVANAAECFLLDDSTPCGQAFSGYPILLSTAQSNQEFTNQIQLNIKNSTSVANQLDCQNGVFATQGLRYQESIQCAIETFNAITAGCQFKGPYPKGPLLCKTECALAQSSLKLFLQNTTGIILILYKACGKSGLSNSNAVNTLSRYANYCLSESQNESANQNVRSHIFTVVLY